MRCIIALREEYTDFNQYVSDLGKDQNSIFSDSFHN